MKKPLEQLFSSTTAALSFPIDLIVYDPMVYITAHIAHHRQIPIQIFVPNSLMFVKRYTDICMGHIENTLISAFFANQIMETFSLVDEIICNSIEPFAMNYVRKHCFVQIYPFDLLPH